MGIGGEMSFLLSQVISLGPLLLVYLAAIILAFNYMGRARIPSILTLFGVAISVVTIVGEIAAQRYIVSNQESGIGISEQLMFVGVLGSIGSAVGKGFFVAAIFIGRNYVPTADRYLHE